MRLSEGGLRDAAAVADERDQSVEPSEPDEGAPRRAGDPYELFDEGGVATRGVEAAAPEGGAPTRFAST